MNVRIGLGFTGLPFQSGSALWRWVDLCEAGGVDSIWLSDRLVGDAPSLECLSTLGGLAARTRRLKFGMSILSLGWRDPLEVAKACASIDFLSEGRLLPAFGIGALQAPEWQALGLPSEGQGARMDAALEVISRLWRGESVDQGDRRGMRIAPLPVQRELPLWIGGSSPAAIRRTVRFGTGWLGGVEGPAQAGAVVAAIRLAAAAAGREIDPGHFGGGFFYWLGSEQQAQALLQSEARRPWPPGVARSLVAGDRSTILRRIAEYREVGVTKLVLRPLAADESDMLSQTRALVETVLPAL